MNGPQPTPSDWFGRVLYPTGTIVLEPVEIAALLAQLRDRFAHSSCQHPSPDYGEESWFGLKWEDVTADKRPGSRRYRYLFVGKADDAATTQAP
jgi:hypothetical protein